MPFKPPHRVLVVGPSWIGDMVMAHTLFMLLRERLPGTRIDVLAPPATASLLARIPEVDGSVIVDIPHGRFALGERWRIAAGLRASQYDQAIVLQRSAKAALIPAMAGIPQRTGYRGELRFGLINDVRRLDVKRHPLKIEHYALLGLAREGDALPGLHMPALRIDEAQRTRLVRHHRLDTERTIVGFAPGAAYGGAKQWPATHYARLAAGLDAEGIACWIFGSQADRAVADAMIAAAPRHGVDMSERTTLTDVVDLASLTTRFVGNDTGIMHLASATAPSVIGIYGSTDPDYAPPLARQSQRLWLGTACSPCRKRTCPLGHNACMRDIAVADVLKACLEPGARDIRALHRMTG